MAYDKAAVQMKGLAAITNFDLSLYLEYLDPGACQLRGMHFALLQMMSCVFQLGDSLQGSCFLYASWLSTFRPQGSAAA